MYNSKEALKLAIFEYEKDLEYDDDNQWVINVLKGLKEVKQDLEKLEKENQELKNTILSLELDTCIPELRKENTKLKKIIKLLEDNLQLVLKQDIDPLLNRKVYIVGISKNYKLYSGFEVTQEQYKLIEEYKKNER